MRSNTWDVVHAYDSSLLGWTVLVPRRHVESIDELTRSEAHELADLLRAVTSFLRAYVGCSKTYVMQFAEHPQHPHIHFHVVPRQPDIPAGNVGPNVFNYLGAEGPERVSEDAMNQLAQAMRERLASVDNDGTEHE